MTDLPVPAAMEQVQLASDKLSNAAARHQAAAASLALFQRDRDALIRSAADGGDVAPGALAEADGKIAAAEKEVSMWAEARDRARARLTRHERILAAAREIETMRGNESKLIEAERLRQEAERAITAAHEALALYGEADRALGTVRGASVSGDYIALSQTGGWQQMHKFGANWSKRDAILLNDLRLPNHAEGERLLARSIERQQGFIADEQRALAE